MYSLNPIPRNVLITPDECTSMFKGNAIDPSVWAASIEIAEERFVRPVLGYAFYEAIATAKNTLVTSGNIASLQSQMTAKNITLSVGQIVNGVEILTAANAAYGTLWAARLARYCFEAVYYVAQIDNYTQFSAQGILKNNPEGSVLGEKAAQSVGVGLNDIKWLTDKQLLDRINPFKASLEQYLCVNIASYPLYDNCNCQGQGSDANSVKSAKRTTPFVDIYDDHDERRNPGAYLYGNGYYSDRREGY